MLFEFLSIIEILDDIFESFRKNNSHVVEILAHISVVLVGSFNRPNIAFDSGLCQKYFQKHFWANILSSRMKLLYIMKDEFYPTQ